MIIIRGLVWFGVVWCGLVWFGVVWCGLGWFGVVWDKRVPGKYMKTKRNQLNIKLPIHLQDEKVAYTLLDHFVQNRTT